MRNSKLALGALVAVVAAIAVVLALGTAPGHAKSNGVYKAAWVYVGPHNDGGWSQAHDVGRQYVQKALGSKVQTTYKENVPEGPQTCQVLDQLARDGNQIIFATSYGFQPCVLSEAKKYPDVKFEMATGDQQAKNVTDYYGAGEDAIYLSGIAAGAATKTGVVGYVVPFAIPEVIRHTNAFALGVQTAHPGAKVKIIWTNSWFAPDKEKKAAENLKAAGADVIGQNVDDPAIGEYDQSQGIPWVGYDSNAKKFAKTSWLTGAVYNWGPYYLSGIKKAMNGTWKSQFWYGSLKSGFAQLAPYGPKVSAATKKLIAQKKAQIESGKWYEFQGPIYDQSGKLRVKKGQRLTVKDLYAINWLVKGVVGSPKG
ncbi:MAG TPA: BMP family ABC transporter substrate-binding protein [Gaiellaceae bacterium]|nr:BMP family ABC transporter substrate-binding protein [Gaiellaceae bacterium]